MKTPKIETTTTTTRKMTVELDAYDLREMVGAPGDAKVLIAEGGGEYRYIGTAAPAVVVDWEEESEHCGYAGQALVNKVQVANHVVCGNGGSVAVSRIENKHHETRWEVLIYSGTDTYLITLESLDSAECVAEAALSRIIHGQDPLPGVTT